MPALLHAPHPPFASSAGFTAIELMVAVAIIAVLAALATPGFAEVIERYRLRRTSDEMTATIFLARTEALRRGGKVTLRKASLPGCASKELNDWSCGWQIDADADDDGRSGPAVITVQSWPAPQRVEVTMHAAQPSSQFEVNRWGRFGNTQGFSIILRPSGSTDAAAARVLCISAGGRLQALQRTDRCPG